MKKTASLIICVSILLSAGCVKRQFHGVETAQSSSFWGFFKSVDSCTPTLSWKPSGETGVTYDVAVNEALAEKANVPPDRGNQVFYVEKISAPSVQIQPSLAPEKKYLWSVRVRKPTGEISAWATYNKSVTMPGAFEESHNLWFGIKTPECAGGVARTAETAIKYDFNKKSDYEDVEIVERLRRGQGALVLGNFSYGVKERKANLSKYQNIEEVISKETEPLKPKRVPINVYIIPPNSQSEIELSPNGNNAFIFMGSPGTYTLSRLVYNWGYYTYAYRVFVPFKIEAQKMIYGGDIISLAFKNIIGIYAQAEPHFRFRPEGFRSLLNKKYSSSFPNLVDQNLALSIRKQ